MHRWFAALIVASILAFGLAASGAAQTCADYASQADAQFALDNGGDPTVLDPEGDGVACATTGDISANQDGPVMADDASGASGQSDLVTSEAPGQTSTNTQDGTGNNAGVDVTQGGDTGATDGGTTDTGTTDGGATDTGATDTGATDTGATDGGTEAAAAPSGETVATDDAAAAAPAVSAGTTAATTSAAGEATTATRLPSTGTGTAAPAGDSAALALVAMLGAVVLLVVRRYQQN